MTVQPPLEVYHPNKKQEHLFAASILMDVSAQGEVLYKVTITFMS